MTPNGCRQCKIFIAKLFSLSLELILFVNRYLEIILICLLGHAIQGEFDDYPIVDHFMFKFLIGRVDDIISSARDN